MLNIKIVTETVEIKLCLKQQNPSLVLRNAEMHPNTTGLPLQPQAGFLIRLLIGLRIGQIVLTFSLDLHATPSIFDARRAQVGLAA